MMERAVTVRVREGLHARPAARFVQLAKGFESAVEIARGPRAVSAKSTVKLMLLGVKEDETVTLRVHGPDETAAMDQLAAFLMDPQAGLEDSHAPMPDAPTMATGDDAPLIIPPQGVKGIAASEGLHCGPVFAHFADPIEAPGKTVPEAERPAELARLREAFATVRREIDAAARDDLPAGDRAIMAALAEIASDDALVGATQTAVQHGDDALTAVVSASETLSGQFRELEDPYLRARGDDIAAVGRRIALALLGRQPEDLNLCPQGAVIVADDIAAFDLARADHKRIGALVCAAGGATSHIAIIARSHGIPAVLGLGIEQARDCARARDLAVDGRTGMVVPDPGSATRARFAAAIDAAISEKRALSAWRDIEPRLADGTLITIAANLGSLEEIDAAREAGAMGVGLFRTELLFMRQRTLPSEDMQYEAYRKLVESFPDHPVIVRTLDVGGDKPVAGIAFPHEDNPFLGWRGIRMCLDKPEVFRPQLRALLRAARHGDLKVMIPMVATLDELDRTDALLAECRRALQSEGTPHGDVDLGIMMETPAAVMIAHQLAKKAKFFSIGTNDLTQYIMAADRLNPHVSALNKASDPAVMRAVELIAEAGNEAGIMVGICGESAGKADLTRQYVKFGITELSMSPSSILRVKKAVGAMRGEASA